ncbi:hypothetical protein RRF57_008229 [Xylaria bambusicola]|uniref:Uncharacterized protein n=1 Tax=Xylaria bambusicola TaxID=326684 RepID=A0AAN7UHD1_9PEZI
MASKDNDSPSVADPVVEAQTVQPEENNVAEKWKDSTDPTDDPQCIRHPRQGEKSDETNWRTWLFSRPWRSLKERPR